MEVDNGEIKFFCSSATSLRFTCFHFPETACATPSAEDSLCLHCGYLLLNSPWSNIQGRCYLTDCALWILNQYLTDATLFFWKILNRIAPPDCPPYCPPYYPPYWSRGADAR